MSTLQETNKADGSLNWASEATPNYAEGVANLYNWASNFNNFEPFAKFLDLIGYSADEYGAPLMDWQEPSRSLGYMELGYLAEALTEYANRPHEVTRYISELLEVESEYGI